MVIAIIAVLLAILLPGLAHARMLSRRTRESAACAQLLVAYHLYADEHRDFLLPAESAPPHQTPPLDNRGQLLGDSASRPYAWRIWPYLNDDVRALVVDPQLLAAFLSLPDRPASDMGYQSAVAHNPTFGINGTFLGGRIKSPIPGGGLISRRKPHVTKLADVLFPSRLLVFASSRGPGIGSLGIVDGWALLEAPRSMAGDMAWYEIPLDAYAPERDPLDYGYLHPRYARAAVVGQVDGHVETLGLSTLRDMRRWANPADTPDWNPRIYFRPTGQPGG